MIKYVIREQRGKIRNHLSQRYTDLAPQELVDITGEDEDSLKKTDFKALERIEAAPYVQTVMFSAAELVVYNGENETDDELRSCKVRGKATIPPNKLAKVYQGYYQLST